MNDTKDEEKAFIICELSSDPDLARKQLNKLIELVDSDDTENLSK